MSIPDLLTLIQNSALAHAISKTNHLVGAGLQVVHILGFVMLLSALVLICLRLFGLVFSDRPLADITQGPGRLLWWGFGTAALSGLLMFVASPVLYASKDVFLLKLILLAAAVLVQISLFRHALAQDKPTVTLVRTAAFPALLLWFGVAATGRAIGFL